MSQARGARPRLASMLLLASVTAGAQTAAAPDGPGKPIKTTITYEPVVTMAPQSRELVACGLQMTVLRDDVPLISTALTQAREGEGTIVRWCATPRDLLEDDPRTGLAALEVRGGVRLETPVPLPPVTAQEGCTVIEDASLLFQRLFVGGGTLRIALEGQPTLSVTLKRPLPGDLIRSYLNCAGDLFRPDDAVD